MTNCISIQAYMMVFTERRGWSYVFLEECGTVCLQTFVMNQYMTKAYNAMFRNVDIF